MSNNNWSVFSPKQIPTTNSETRLESKNYNWSSRQGTEDVNDFMEGRCSILKIFLDLKC
jgi:hypothetical protein